MEPKPKAPPPAPKHEGGERPAPSAEPQAAQPGGMVSEGGAASNHEPEKPGGMIGEG
jgi:hypothetical protein